MSWSRKTEPLARDSKQAEALAMKLDRERFRGNQNGDSESDKIRNNLIILNNQIFNHKKLRQGTVKPAGTQDQTQAPASIDQQPNHLSSAPLQQPARRTMLPSQTTPLRPAKRQRHLTPWHERFSSQSPKRMDFQGGPEHGGALQ
jgi:hypothetical protein